VTLLLLFLLYAVALSVGLAFAGYRAPVPPVPSAPESRGRPTRLLVVGATGGTGRQIVAQALERGFAVTAFVRNPARLSISHPQLTVVTGDVLDAGAVDAAVRGQEAVLSALGHKRYFSPKRILSEGTVNIVRAMEAHGVSRFVCETALGIGDSAGRMGLYYTFFTIPVVLPLYFWDKTRQERIIAGSNVEWTIVRPGLLTNAEKRGRYRHGFHVGSFLWTVRISRGDVADFMLNQLESNAYLRRAPGVCG
jgi:putative NADH-flavin reductase